MARSIGRRSCSRTSRRFARSSQLPKLSELIFQGGGICMKIASLVARYLLGFIFLVFGLNGFLHFIPTPPPSGVAGDFLGAMFVSKYLLVVSGLQVHSGPLLLVNRCVPLALTFLGPIIVNILLFHALMSPVGIVPGVVVTVLWFVVYWQFRAAFYGIFCPKAQSDRSR